MRNFRYFPVFLLALILFAAGSASAAVLGPGCRAATAQDQKDMQDRGLPLAYEVCPKDAQILGIGESFDQWYTRIKAMSPCNKTTCTLSCRTRNTGAQVCGPTSKRWSSIGCHPNNNTAIFPTVSHGFAAHIELLRRYCGERGRCTIGTVTQQWATGTNGSTQSPYAAFVSKAAGIPANQVYDPNDIDLVGRMAMAMACFEAGSLPYTADELKQGLIMAAGGARVPVPANVGALLNESLSGSYSANPAGSPNSHPGSWAYPQSSISNNSYQPPPPPANPLPIIKPSATNATNPFANGPLANQPTSNTNTSTSYNAALQSSALIIAQPKSVRHGDPILVSWTSVGMDPQTLCQVTAGGSVVAQKNSGSQLIPTTLSQVGTLTFTLSCTTRAGAQIQQSTTVNVS